MPFAGDRFSLLCDNVQSCFALIDDSILELLDVKDQLLLQAIPLRVLLRVTLVLSRVFRAYSNAQVPVHELIGLVQAQRDTFNARCALFKRFCDSHELNKRMLNIALQQIAAANNAAEKDQERACVQQWESMYIRLALPRSNVRKWKFRLETFREKTVRGYEHVLEWLHADVVRAASPLESLQDDQAESLDDSDSSVEEPPVNDDVEEEEQAAEPTPITLTETEVQVQPEVVDQQTSTGDRWTSQSLIMRIYRPVEILRESLQCTVHAQGRTYTTKEWTRQKAPTIRDKDTNKAVRSATQLLSSEVDKQANDELVVPISNIHSISRNEADAHAIKIDVYGDKMLFGSSLLSWNDLLELPTLHRHRPPALIAMENEAPRRISPFDFDLASMEVYRSALGETPQTFPVYDDQGEHRAKLPLLLFWYNDSENAQATKCTMTAAIVPDEPKQVKPRPLTKPSRIATLTAAYESEITRIEQSYQAEIQRLTTLLQQRQSSAMANIDEEDENVSSTRHEGVSDVVIRKQLPKPEDAPTHSHLQISRPDTSDHWPSHYRHQARPSSKRRVEVQQQGYKAEPSHAFDDLCLPGVFTPFSSRHIYNPRASQYFHPVGTTASRLTQPPSIFKLPPVPSGSLSVLNLFELTRCEKSNADQDPPAET